MRYTGESLQLALPYESPGRRSSLAITVLHNVSLCNQAALVIGEAAMVGDLDKGMVRLVAIGGAYGVEVYVGVCVYRVLVDMKTL